MFDKIKNLFKKQEVKPVVKKESKPKQQKPPTPELTAKEKATAASEPYVAINKVEINPENINDGSFD
jgi:predicted SprT family Zn-dependent metalloprotease